MGAIATQRTYQLQGEGATAGYDPAPRTLLHIHRGGEVRAQLSQEAPIVSTVHDHTVHGTVCYDNLAPIHAEPQTIGLTEPATGTARDGASRA